MVAVPRTAPPDSDRATVRPLRDAIARWRRVVQHHLRGPDGLNFARRRVEQGADTAWVHVAKRMIPQRTAGPFDGDPRFALLTVNFSTTRYLKLLLLTLGDQQELGLVHRIVIADNDSRDGGRQFLRELSARVARVVLVEHQRFLNHARGMRGALRALAQVEAQNPDTKPTNLLLFCDTDVVFRNHHALDELAAATVAHDAALVGELRKMRAFEYPDVQASFFIVRRDAYERSDIASWVNQPAPAYALQRDIWRAGLTVINFPTYQGGYVLHRGRSGIVAAKDHSPRHSYATVADSIPHFMGVPGGSEIWAAIEARYANLLEPSSESQLLEVLANKLSRLGS